MGNEGRDYYRQDRPRTPGIVTVWCVRMERTMSSTLDVWRVIIFLYTGSHHLLHNLTDMRRKASACIDLRVAMVPESYHCRCIRDPLLPSPICSGLYTYITTRLHTELQWFTEHSDFPLLSRWCHNYAQPHRTPLIAYSLRLTIKDGLLPSYCKGNPNSLSEQLSLKI
jgi:hypothetical protein